MTKAKRMGPRAIGLIESWAEQGPIEITGGRLFVVVLTPERARELLGYRHESQRRIRPDHVALLKASMDGGVFHGCGRPIALNDTGYLVDGQHRLTALAETRFEMITTAVVYGAPGAVLFVDVDQRSRTVGDAQRFGGDRIVHSTVAAGILYEARGLHVHWMREPLPMSERLATINGCPFLDEVIGLHRKAKSTLPAGVLAVAISVMRLGDAERVEAIRFFSQARDNVHDGDPTGAIRYLATWTARPASGKGGGGGTSYLYECAYRAMASWNKHATNQSVGRGIAFPAGADVPAAQKLRWRPGA